MARARYAGVARRTDRDMFSFSDRKLQVAVNWGLALLLYVLVGRPVAGLLWRPRP